MARVKLSMPDEIIFECNYLVGVADINYGNHVGNDRILTIAHECRLRFVRSLGYKDELSFGDDIGFIQSDAEVVYKAEAHHGDNLRITLAIDGVHKYGFETYYQVENADTGVIVAIAKTGMLFFNYETKRPVEIPKNFKY